jgi:hypothetical protein
MSLESRYRQDSREVARAAARFARVGVVLIVAGLSGACATISIPLDGFLSSARKPSDAELTTGSVRAPVERVETTALAPLPAAPSPPTTVAVAPPAPPAPALLDERHAGAIRAALPSGMLEAERAATVPWLHETSRTGGVIAPVGAPIRQGEATCRAVVVSIEHEGQRRFVQGNACRAPGFDWSLVDLRPWTNPI